MSIQCGVDCLDCRQYGPGIGDGGFLGAPTLSVEEECETSYESMPSFGYFYEPLLLLGLRRYDLDDLRDWLAAHGGHRLYLSGDHDDSSKWPAELLAMEEDEALREAFRKDHLARKARREARTASGEFMVALYELSCSECDANHTAHEPELLRSFDRLTVPPEARKMFLERWAARSPDDGWNHRLGGTVDPYEPFIEGLPDFLNAHAGHALQARLLPRDVPKGTWLP
jgi:hypothetical protein